VLLDGPVRKAPREIAGRLLIASQPVAEQHP